jgi:hypothetical protein
MRTIIWRFHNLDGQSFHFQLGSSRASNLRRPPSSDHSSRSEVHRRLLQGKTLTVSLKKPWNYLSETVSEARQRDEKNLKGYHYPLVCCLAEKLRTHYEANVLENKGSPHPSPHGEPLASENALSPKELKPVSVFARPPTASVSASGGSQLSASTHVPAPSPPKHARPLSPAARPTGSREKLLSPFLVPCHAAVNGGEICYNVTRTLFFPRPTSITLSARLYECRQCMPL